MDAEAIMKRIRELEEENQRLKTLLVEHGIPFEENPSPKSAAISQV